MVVLSLLHLAGGKLDEGGPAPPCVPPLVFVCVHSSGSVRVWHHAPRCAAPKHVPPRCSLCVSFPADELLTACFCCISPEQHDWWLLQVLE